MIGIRPILTAVTFRVNSLADLTPLVFSAPFASSAVKSFGLVFALVFALAFCSGFGLAFGFAVAACLWPVPSGSVSSVFLRVLRGKRFCLVFAFAVAYGFVPPCSFVSSVVKGFGLLFPIPCPLFPMLLPIAFERSPIKRRSGGKP